MTNGWAFFLGWMASQLYFTFGLDLVRWLGSRARPRVRRRWTIGGRVHTPRTITRPLMEQIIAIQADVPEQIPSFIQVITRMSDNDMEEMQARKTAAFQASTSAMYKVARLVVEDRSGEQPTEDEMDELPVETVNEIVQACL